VDESWRDRSRESRRKVLDVFLGLGSAPITQAPIVTPHGVVLIYHGADDRLVHRTGIAIFDRSDPGKLIWPGDEPVFFPQRKWEKAGKVSNVALVEGMVGENDRYLFYYGGADTYVGVAEAPVSPWRLI
jgi:predicted GH43/DUF377 family glycosyl hydrolase